MTSQCGPAFTVCVFGTISFSGVQKAGGAPTCSKMMSGRHVLMFDFSFEYESNIRYRGIANGCIHEAGLFKFAYFRIRCFCPCNSVQLDMLLVSEGGI